MSVMNSYQRASARMFDPRMIVPFLIASLALGIMANVLLDLLKVRFGESFSVLLAVLGGAALVLLLMFVVIRLTLRWSPAAELSLSNHVAPEPRRGVVFMVSVGKGKESCLQAFEHHKSTIERAWLICSGESQEAAADLKDQMQERKPGVEAVILQVRDVYDPQPFFEAVRSIYKVLADGWVADDIICDFTGMTAHASVGMCLACVKYDWPLEYTPPRLGDDGRIVGSLPPISVILPVKNRPPTAAKGTA